MIEEIRKHKTLLIVVALLVVLKIVVLPILAWQDSLLVESSLLQNKKARIERLFASETRTDEYAAELNARIKQAETVFLQVTEKAKFQLERQQWLEAKLSLYSLQSNNFGWAPVQFIPELDLISQSAQLSMSGKTSDIVSFMRDLQTQAFYISIEGFALNLSGQRDENLGKGQFRLNLTFYGQGKNVS
jgi:hypothetical protein